MPKFFSVPATIVIAFVAIGIVCCSDFGWPCYRNKTDVVTTSESPNGEALSLKMMGGTNLLLVLRNLDSRVFTTDNCGADVYIHAYWNFEAYFVDQLFASILCNHYGVSQVHMESTLLRVGDIQDTTDVRGQLAHPLPEEWLHSGPLIQLHFTNFISVDSLVLICSPRYFGTTYVETDLEIVIDFTGCAPNKYGGDCSRDCNCENGGLCHDFNGACYCQKGWTGTNCAIPNPTVEISQTPKAVLYTGNVTLTCVAYGMTSQTMTWTKNRDIVRSTEGYTVYRDGNVLSLEISHVQHGDDGLYTCNVESSNGRTFELATVLTSSDHQSFTNEPNDVTVLVGSDVVFQCAVADRAGQLYWYMDGDTILAVGDDVISEWAKARFSVDSDAEGGRYNLNIKNVTTEDDREYHCGVGPAFEQKAIASKSAQLTVLESAADPTIDEAGDFASLNFLADSPVTVTCRAQNGKPPASINWYKNGVLVTTNVTTMLEVGTRNRMDTVSVLAAQLTYDDVAGNITCEAWSDVLSYRKKVSVTLEDLKYKPRVNVTYEPRTPREGDNVTFSCHAEANPGNVTYRWVVQNDLARHENGSLLKLFAVKGQESALEVTCVAKNEVGDGYYRTSVNIRTHLSNKWILMVVLCGCFGLTLVLVAPVITYLQRYKMQRWLLWHFGGYEENDGKTYDAFVSYKGSECGSEDRTEDEKFVHDILIPELERGGKYIICEHHRNFVPGVDIATNIISAINASRRTILVLSPGFVRSEWCRFEFLKAQEEMLKKKIKIIPIMLEDISTMEDMDANLKSLLSEISYISWSPEDSGNRFWDNMKYAMPRKRPRKAGDAAKRERPIMLTIASDNETYATC